MHRNWVLHFNYVYQQPLIRPILKLYSIQVGVELLLVRFLWNFLIPMGFIYIFGLRCFDTTWFIFFVSASTSNSENRLSSDVLVLSVFVQLHCMVRACLNIPLLNWTSYGYGLSQANNNRVWQKSDNSTDWNLFSVMQVKLSQLLGTLIQLWWSISIAHDQQFAHHLMMMLSTSSSTWNMLVYLVTSMKPS